MRGISQDLLVKLTDFAWYDEVEKGVELDGLLHLENVVEIHDRNVLGDLMALLEIRNFLVLLGMSTSKRNDSLVFDVNKLMPISCLLTCESVSSEIDLRWLLLFQVFIRLLCFKFIFVIECELHFLSFSKLNFSGVEKSEPI